MKKYTHREFVREFLFFLKTNNAYKQYIQNIKTLNKCKSWINYINPLTIDNLKHEINDGNYKELINCAFIWSSTPQGQFFWDDLDKRWRNKIQKIELKYEKIK